MTPGLNTILKVVGALLLLGGCSGASLEDQAKALGTRPFAKEAWATGTQQERGEMVASFLSQYKPATLTRRDVVSLLGSPTGYYEYDENPAYLVGPPISSVYGNGYLFAFVTDKSTGHVRKVVLLPEPRPGS